MNKVTLAIAKGRLGEEGIGLFEGSKFEIVRESSPRKLVFTDRSGQLSFIFVKSSDVITYVERGIAQLGIVGKDNILEEGKDVYELLDLQFGCCKFAIAGFPNQSTIKIDEPLRIATSYPAYVKSVFKDRNQKFEIIKLNGSVELAPLMGLSDVIVDIVETGNTLRENGLVILEELHPISGRLIVNKVSYRFLYDLVQEIKQVLERQIAC